MARRISFSEKQFNIVKKKLNSKKYKTIGQVAGWAEKEYDMSYQTVRRINKANSYQGYIDNLRIDAERKFYARLREKYEKNKKIRREQRIRNALLGAAIALSIIIVAMLITLTVSYW